MLFLKITATLCVLLSAVAISLADTNNPASRSRVHLKRCDSVALANDFNETDRDMKGTFLFAALKVRY